MAHPVSYFHSEEDLSEELARADTWTDEEKKMMELLESRFKGNEKKKIVEMAQEQTVKRMISAMYSRHYKRLLEEGRPTGTALDIVPREIVEGYIKSEKKTENHVMITVSAKEQGIDPAKFWKRFEEWVSNQTLVEPVISTLEQRSEGDTPAYGFHIHLIAKTTNPPSKIAQRMIKSFSGFVVAQNYIDIKRITKDLDVRLAYLKGEKKEEKMGKVEKDIQIKNALGIPLFKEYNL